MDRWRFRAVTGCQPFAVKINLAVDEIERLGPVGNRLSDPRAVLGQKLLPLTQCAVALPDQRRVLPHLRDGHAGPAQPVHQIEPVEMKVAVYATAAGVAHHARNQSLRLIPADGVNASPCACGKLADVNAVGHGMLLSEESIRQAGVHSRSSGFLSAAKWELPIHGVSVRLKGMAPSPFLTAEWRMLAMLNYEVDPGLLNALVPAGTELDRWQGRLYVSLVAVRFLDTRVLGIPIPFHRDFDELNLRFYVRRPAGDEVRRGGVVGRGG